MTIQELLKKYHKIEIELLLANVLKKPKEFVFLHPEYKPTRIQVYKLTSMIRRRLRGEPIAYILGYKDFYGLRFKVNKNVLIPRPETETLVDHIVRACRELYFPTRFARSKNIKILDVGTGSGCIIISLTRELGSRFKIQGLRPEFYGSDISESALNIAKLNFLKHRAKVRFVKSDLLKNIKFDFDILVANLPYGWSEWKNNSSAETRGLKFEPKQALFAGQKGLHQIGRLLAQISARKNKAGFIFLEFDPRQKKDLYQLIKKHLPKADVKFYRDFAKRWRVVEIAV